MFSPPTSPTYNTALIVAMRACRYVTYFGLVVLLAANAYQQMAPLPWALALLPLSGVAVHACFHFSRGLLLWAQLLEAVFLFLLLWLAQVPLLAFVAVAGVVVGCNAALFGVRSWSTALGCAAVLGYAGWGPGSGVVAEQAVVVSDVRWLELVAVLFASAVLITASALGHRQTRRYLTRSQQATRRSLQLQRYLPAALAEHLDAQVGDRPPRRRWFCVAFVDLSGFTAMVDRLAPEAVDEVLNDYLYQVDRAVQGAHGQIYKFLGDGVLCVFPAALATERAGCAVQAVRMLCRLPEVLRQNDERWAKRGISSVAEVSMGMASGFCMVGEWGWQERCDFTVIGTPVNLAARLQGVATPGTLVVDATTMRMIGNAVAWHDLGAVSLKGLPETHVYRPLPG